VTARLYVLVFRALSVLNVALALAVLTRAPRLVEVALATLACGVTVWVIALELADVAIARRTRRRDPHT